MRFRRFVLIFALLAITIVVPLYAYKVAIKTDYTDFLVYYRAASRVKAGDWTHVYTLMDGASPFRYAPITLPWFRPFAELSPLAARLAWYFLQCLWFGSAFGLIYAALKRLRVADPLFVTAFSFLFILRFCLDCFTIGQVSSLLFLGFCGGFYFWVSRRPGWAANLLLIPSIFKIGPGFVYPLFLKGRFRDQRAAVLAPLAALVALLAGTALWVRALAGSWEVNRLLWNGWLEMVAKDSVYYDASHYGSQSIKSALLRLVKAHILSAPVAQGLYLSAAVVVCGAILFFWLLRRPRGFPGRAAFYCLGIFPYLWIMPETFKYSLTVLALPVALLVADWRRISRFDRFAVIFGLAVLSLAGKDLVGDTLFFGSQKLSVPLLATIFLGVSIFKLSWMKSEPSRFARSLRDLFFRRNPGPLLELSEKPKQELAISLLLPVPLDSWVDVDRQALGSFIHEAHAILNELAPGAFEFLITPFGNRASDMHPLWQSLRAEFGPLSGVGFGATLGAPANRSLALRRSFSQSRGRTIFFAHAEQICDPAFYREAWALINQGFALVRGNRRLAETRFRIPVKVLHMVYRRHRMGLRFNRIVRAILPIETTDTHSGVLAVSRPLAREAFALQSSSNFLFDIELALVAETHQAKQRDLPVTLRLFVEKKEFRVFRESVKILFGLPTLARRYRSGCYDPFRALSHQFTADDWGLTPEVNRGILELARRGIIRRVSIMANTLYLSEGLDELRAVPGIELGLHFDLTFGKSSPGRVLLQWLGGNRSRLRSELLASLEAQLKTLREHGIHVAYVDGHHHIHLVPGIFRTMIPILKREKITTVRLPYDPSQWWSGKAALNLLSLLLKGELRRAGFTSLPCYYPKQDRFLDLGRFRSELAHAEGFEVIVHPARDNDLGTLGIPDSYREGRVIEYRALRMLAATEDA